MQIASIDFYGLKLSIIDRNTFLNKVCYTIRENEKTVCYGYSFGAINLMRKYHQICQLGNTADIMLADGRPFYLLCKLLKYPLISDISIPNAVLSILELADRNGYSILLLGANQEINAKACERISENYRTIKSVNGINGYFADNEEGNIVDLINNYSPDILLIGMNSPKKESFVLRNRTKLNTKFIMPCGGMIDVLAGKIKVTPDFIKKIGLASFYRLFQEPRRLFNRHLGGYIFIVFYFLPALLFNITLKANKKFSIPAFLRIDNQNTY